MSNDHKDIQQQERDLFASMATVYQPLAPDSAPTPPVQTSSQATDNLPWDHADAMKVSTRAFR